MEEVIKLGPGEHEASSLKYWNAGYEGILIEGGRKVRFEGAGKGKTVVKGGRFLIREGSAGELVGLTIADSPAHFSIVNDPHLPFFLRKSLIPCP